MRQRRDMNGNGKSSMTAVVAEAGSLVKFATIIAGVEWWLVASLGMWLLLFVLDNLLNLPAGLRLPLALGGFAVVAVGFVKRVSSPAAKQQRIERVAVMLEKRYGIPDNLLINACQFEDRRLPEQEQVFARATINACQSVVGNLSFSGLWDLRRLLRWGAAAAALMALWGVYVVKFPKYFVNAGLRYAAPLRDQPPVTPFSLKIEPGTDVTVVEGQNLDIRAAVFVEPDAKKKFSGAPVIVWREGAPSVETVKTGGDNAPMLAVAAKDLNFAYTFTDIRRPFAFRVFAANAYSRSVRVNVRPLPRIKESVFRLTPPAYTGLGVVTNPGPPAAIAGLPGSKLEALIAVEPAAQTASWKQGDKSVAFASADGRWQTETVLASAGAYEIEVTEPSLAKPLLIARGEVGLETDNPPEIDFITDDRNRLATLGSALKLDVQAKDDYGVARIDVTIRPAEQEEGARSIKQWSYLGPPGNRGPLKESLTLKIDPREFAADAAYVIEAVARDFRPGAKPGKSRPVILRIRSPENFTVAPDDPLARAFQLLKLTIAKQEMAINLTQNLKTHLDEALEHASVPQHKERMGTQQGDAQTGGERAIGEFKKHADGKLYASRMDPLVGGEMKLVLGGIDKINDKKTQVLPRQLTEIEDRQNYILMELVALLGQFADSRKEKLNAVQPGKEELNPPLTTQDVAKDLTEDLKQFAKMQEKILERTKSLLDKRPEDLTEEEQKILGELAREEAQWAKFLEEKLTDFSKLPLQDFADGSLAKELNEVWQDVKLAEKSLYEKKIELAVPQEQSGLENAKELVQNLERWMPDTPDHLKWNMEEPPTPFDTAVAELPSELEDIVGELLDKEEEMTDDVEDVSSSWNDSPDKGAGWDAMDGPISSMAAKGITGNQLPNQMEIGGRSGEGRTGRSMGQFVEDSAEGKGGRETPTRVSPTPYEQGSVKDSSKDSKGGATGGGKLSGYSQEGLRGPAAPDRSQKMPRLAEQQATIRQKAEALALKLRAYHVPTGDLEASIAAMKRFEDAAKKNDGFGVRQSFSRIVDALADAKDSAKQESGLHRERTKLPEWMRDEISTGLQDGVPKGYEEMISEYFRALAENKPK